MMRGELIAILSRARKTDMLIAEKKRLLLAIEEQRRGAVSNAPKKRRHDRTDKVSEVAAKKLDIIEDIKGDIQQAFANKARANKLINLLPKDGTGNKMRTLLSAYYLRDMTWSKAGEAAGYESKSGRSVALSRALDIIIVKNDKL